jgi:hypothetical protein
LRHSVKVVQGHTDFDDEVEPDGREVGEITWYRILTTVTLNGVAVPDVFQLSGSLSQMTDDVVVSEGVKIGEEMV